MRKLEEITITIAAILMIAIILLMTGYLVINSINPELGAAIASRIIGEECEPYTLVTHIKNYGGGR